jgi:hypothetical protein
VIVIGGTVAVVIALALIYRKMPRRPRRATRAQNERFREVWRYDGTPDAEVRAIRERLHGLR